MLGEVVGLWVMGLSRWGGCVEWGWLGLCEVWCKMWGVVDEWGDVGW